VGGEDDKVVLRSVDAWDPVRDSWKQLACLPFAVSKHGLAASGDGLMYMAGGEYPDGTASKAVWRFDPRLNSWQELSSMRTPRSELGLALLDGCLYAVGGWDGHSRLASVERYDVRANEWTVLDEGVDAAVTSPAVVAMGRSLYVCGGAVLEDGDGVDTVSRFDTAVGAWRDVAAMQIPRSGSAICVLNGSLYVMGGWHASTENTNKVERYDPERDAWSTVCPMHERRYRPGVAVLNGKIYVMGGEEGWDRYHESIER
jgi:N-acetylneuraminic acid mutarotase